MPHSDNISGTLKVNIFLSFPSNSLPRARSASATPSVQVSNSPTNCGSLKPQEGLIITVPTTSQMQSLSAKQVSATVPPLTSYGPSKGGLADSIDAEKEA